MGPQGTWECVSLPHPIEFEELNVRDCYELRVSVKIRFNPPNLVRKDKEWTKVGSKWKCKVGTCTVAYCAKWLLTQHLKEVHGLVVEKAKPGRPSIAAGGPRHQDHAKMNVRILGNAMVVQRRNDQKVASHARAKAQREWKKPGSCCKTMSTIPKTSFGQISFRIIIEGVGPQCLGCGQCASRCSITDGER